MPTKHSSFESHLPNQAAAGPSSPAARPRITSPKPADGNGGTGHTGFDSRQLLNALLAARNGDFSMRLPADWAGVEGKIADAFNEIMIANESMAHELDRVSRVVGKEGKIGQRAS